MHQARTEARAEAEAAAEQRLAAALALERAELDKQVQVMLFVRQCGTALACFCRVCMRQTVVETAAHAMPMWQHGARRSGAQRLKKSSRLPNMCHALLIEEISQVDKARAEARAAEAAAEEQVAAALALERADFDEQARSWLCMYSNRAVRCAVLACSGALCVQQILNGAAVHVVRLAAWAMMIGMSCSVWKRLSCS